MMNKASTNISVHIFCRHVFLITLGECLGVKLLGYMVTMSKFVRNYQRELHFAIAPAMYEHFSSSTSLWKDFGGMGGILNIFL